jgi:hypothetical protein
MKFTVRGADHVPYSLLSRNPVQLVKEHNAHGAFLKAMECEEGYNVYSGRGNTSGQSFVEFDHDTNRVDGSFLKSRSFR